MLTPEPDARMAWHAHYKAVRARLDAGPPPAPKPTEQAIIAALAPPPPPEPEPEPEPEPAPEEWVAGMACLSHTKRLLLPILKAHGMVWTEAMRRSNHTPHIKVRAEIYTALRERGWSYPEIGRLCGGRDHTTVIFSIKKHNKRKESK